MADWADRKAAEIIKTVFGNPRARDEIADTLRALQLDSVRIGLAQAHLIVDEGQAGRSLPPQEALARILNACQQI